VRKEGPASGRSRRRTRWLAAAGLAVALVTAACSGSSSGGGSASGAYLKWLPCCTWGTTWSYNYYSPLYVNFPNGLEMLPLAVQNYPSLTSFTPQLASSWTVSGNTLTLNLRPGVNWQNGKPVTSKDVYDTLALDGAANYGGWTYIAGVSTPSTSQVAITMRPGTNPALLEDELFNRPILPAATYGQFVTPSLMQDNVAYYAKNFTDPAAAAKMPQYAAMQADFKKMVAYNPPTIIGDGPFTLKAINTAEALLVKWPGFYAASNVHIPGIDYLNQQNQGIYPLMLSGQADFSNVYMSPAILKQWQATAGSHMAIPHGFTFDLVFNSHRYPLNMTAVRQALAYVMPRANMVAAAYGGASVADRGGVLNEHPDGLPAYLDSLYLTPAEQASLNSYPVDDAKATSLLQSAGFHKSGGKWIMPDGKSFTLTFLVNNATSDVVSSFESASAALNAFGISSSVNETQGTLVTEDTFNGDFDVSMDLIGGPNPLYDNIDQMLGRYQDYETLGPYAGDRGIGFGPTANVPGLGNIDVPSTLDQQAERVGPGPEMNSLVYDWARLVNQQLPYITYATKVYQFSYSTQHFTDWPPVNSQGTSPLWNIMGQGDGNEALTLWLEDGYIRPKS
jgi:peptide/nickel transport system substrate-binding protein